MKTTAKLTFTVLLFMVSILQVHSQQTTQMGPTVDWSQANWMDQNVDNTAISQTSSGEDWLYGVKKYYDPTHTQIGYVTCGYSFLGVTPTPGSPLDYQKVANYLTPACFNYSEQPVLDLNTNTYHFPSGSYNCVEFETDTFKRSVSFGKISVKDLKGNPLWTNRYDVGDLVNVVEVSDGFIAVGQNATKKDFNGNNIPYYSPLNSSNPMILNCADAHSTGHIYVVKTDFNGNIIWQAMYGQSASDGSANDNANNNYGFGYDLIQSSNGDIICVGVATNVTGVTNGNSDERGFVFEVSSTTGALVHSFFAPLSSVPTSQIAHPGLQPYYNGLLGICEIGATQKYVAVGRSFLSANGTPSGINYLEFTKATIISLDQNLNLNSAWGTNNPVFISSQGLGDHTAFNNNTSNTSLYSDPTKIGNNTNIWAVNYHSSNQILIPLVADCSNCAYLEAEGMVI
jgi:hypothetical protein